MALVLCGALAMPFIGGCDREVSHHETTEKKADGTAVHNESTVKEKPDGTVVKETEKSVDKPSTPPNP
jgi:hypothetical protein